MSTRKYGNLILTDNLLDKTDVTKKLNISLANISPNTTRILSIPDANTTVVGTNVSQLLTNKTIQGVTNIVDADNLKTSGSSVNISAAAVPSIGQVLTASSSTSASWQNSPIIYLNNVGIISIQPLALVKQWFGHAIASGGTVVFDITSNGAGGTAIFSNLPNAYMVTSCRKNTSTITSIPFSSVQSISADNKTVTVNILTANSGTIFALGGTYTGMTTNASSCDVYLNIIGT